MRKNAKPTIKAPPILFEQTQKLVATISKKLGAPLICYWNSVAGEICQNDAIALRSVVHHVGRNQRVFMFIKSDGGVGRVSLRMVNILRHYNDRVISLIPLNCESAATMLALGSDEIRMGPLAFLTPVDTSITHDLSPIDKDNDRVRVGQNELDRIINLWNRENGAASKNPYDALYGYLHPLVIGAVDRARSLSLMLCREILSYHMDDAKRIDRISTSLNSDYPAHGYPIMLKEARRVGINAAELDPAIEALLLELNEAYSEMGQQCRTDVDEFNHHDNEILNIHETSGMMIFFRVDKDWHFRQADRTWVYTNEKSSWWMNSLEGGRLRTEKFHIR
jgi:hypothetical protein